MGNEIIFRSDFDGSGTIDNLWVKKSDTVSTTFFGSGIKQEIINNEYKMALDYATPSVVGGIKLGPGLSIDEQGVVSVEGGDGNYVHPGTYPATMIVQDSDHRFVTDVETSYWNGKSDGGHTHPEVTTTESGLMSPSDKTKLDGIVPGSGGGDYILPVATESTLGGVKLSSDMETSNNQLQLSLVGILRAKIIGDIIGDI